MRCRFILLHKAIQRISNWTIRAMYTACIITCATAGLFESRLTLTRDWKLTQVFIFSYMKMFFTAYDLCSLRLFELKTEEQTK